ncbi:MAG: DUF6580 family putative transport protein [Chitinophagaceae bacterium]
MKFNGRMVVFTLLLIAAATMCKFFLGPDLGWSGFSPVIAIALFSGMIVNDKRQSFLLPLIAVFASDVLIHLFYLAGWFPYAGFYSGQWLNYCFLLLVTLIGWAVKGKHFATIFAGALAGPTVFFLLSNFAVWTVAQANYGKGISGLIACYTAGLPFYRNALTGTILFLPLIILAYTFIVKRRTSLTLA